MKDLDIVNLPQAFDIIEGHCEYAFNNDIELYRLFFKKTTQLYNGQSERTDRTIFVNNLLFAIFGLAKLTTMDKLTQKLHPPKPPSEAYHQLLTIAVRSNALNTFRHSSSKTDSHR